MYLITTRPIEDALNDCRILNKRGVNAIASPSMKIKKENPHINFNFDGIFLTSRHAAHIVKNLKDKNIPIFCVGSSTAKIARSFGATNLIVGNSDALHLISLIKGVLKNGSNILWPTNNQKNDLIEKKFKQYNFSLLRETFYRVSSLNTIDGDSLNLIKKNKVSVILFFSLISAKMWIELIKKSNLTKSIYKINYVVINNSIFNYLKKLKLDNVYISRRKRRASVLSKGLEIYKNLENS